VADADYFRLAYHDAIRVISEAVSGPQPDDARIRNLDWRAQPRMEFATRAALCTDPQPFPLRVDLWGFYTTHRALRSAEEHYCADGHTVA